MTAVTSSAPNVVRRSALPLILLLGSVVLVTLRQGPFRLPGPGALLVADLAIGLFVLTAWRSGIARCRDSSVLLVRLLPWLWLYSVAQLVGLTYAGLPLVGLADLAKGIAPFFTLTVVFGWVNIVGGHRTVRVIWLATAVLTATAVLLGSSGARSAGLMGNPNYAAHYLAITAIAIGWLRGSRLSLLIVVLCVLAALRTGSFAAPLMLLAGVGYGAWTAVRRLPSAARTGVRSMVLAVSMFGFAWVTTTSTVNNFDYGSGLDSSRLDRSGSTRTEIWLDAIGLWANRPVGYGPGFIASARARGDNPLGEAGEVHNDLLDALVSGGPLAVVALVMLVATIWRAARPGGVTRAVLVAAIAASPFRQTLNFRHTALLVGICLALEASQLRRPSSSRERLATQP